MSEPLPSAVSLLETIRVFLEQEIAPQVDARSAYLLKVTGNLLDILARENNAGANAKRREYASLRALLAEHQEDGPDCDALNRNLCARIASGRQDCNSEALWLHLLQTTRDRLRIDNPRYKFGAD